VLQPQHPVHHLVERNSMKKFLNDIVGQIWTLLGMFVAWIVLEGTAKTVVGWLIIVSTVIWVLTYPLRKNDD